MDLDLTQKEVATSLGLVPDTVRNWEVGRSSVDIRYYRALIAFLGYNPPPKPKTTRSNNPSGANEPRMVAKTLGERVRSRRGDHHED